MADGAAAPSPAAAAGGDTGVDPELRARLLQTIRSELSARHVPDEVYALPEIPRTLTGKKLEVPVKRILLGHTPDKAVNRDSMANPGIIDWFVAFQAARDAAPRPGVEKATRPTQIDGSGAGSPGAQVRAGAAMPVQAISTDEFDGVVTGNDIVLVDFWAPWCGPCKGFAPVFEQVANENPDVAFVKINTDEESELAGSFAIRSIPTLMVFREQVIVFQQAGALPKGALDDILSQVRKLDMEEVKRGAHPHEPGP